MIEYYDQLEKVDAIIEELIELRMDLESDLEDEFSDAIADINELHQQRLERLDRVFSRSMDRILARLGETIPDEVKNKTGEIK